MSVKEDLDNFYNEIKNKGPGYIPRAFTSSDLNCENPKIYMKMRDDGKCEVMFRINELKDPIKLPKSSAALEITRKIFDESGKPHPNCTEIAFCCIERHETVFRFFASSLIDNIRRDSEPRDILNSLIETFDKWRDLFKNGNTELSNEEIRGLWAELFVFKHLLETKFGKANPGSIVSSWRGPQNSIWDFILENKLAIESKASKDDGVIRISSEYQLNNEKKGIDALVLAVTSLKEDPDGESLYDLYKKIKEKLHEDSLIKEFDTLLSLLNVTPKALEEIYSKQTFYVLNQSLFRVIEGFPRIVSTPNVISSVRYQLKTSSDLCGKYKIATEDLEKLILTSLSLT